MWADYVTEKQQQGKVSVPRMRDAWKALRSDFGPMLPSLVDAARCREYAARRRAAGVGDGTIHAELGYLRAALRHGGYTARVELPSKPRPRTRHLTPDEARRLLDAAQMPHVRLFIELALHTAGRPSSILDLTWNRVDFKRGVIHLDNPARDRTAKGRATVPLPPLLLEPLSAAQRGARTDYVIEWAGKPVQSVKKAVQRTAMRAGIEGVTPYVLRHTAAVWMAEAGVPIVEIAQFMGHTNPSVTFRTYARFSPDYLQGASRAISDRLRGHTGDNGRDEPEAVNGE